LRRLETGYFFHGFPGALDERADHDDDPARH
jgi:hypothetical protein